MTTPFSHPQPYLFVMLVHKRHSDSGMLQTFHRTHVNWCPFQFKGKKLDSKIDENKTLFTNVRRLHLSCLLSSSPNRDHRDRSGGYGALAPAHE